MGLKYYTEYRTLNANELWRVEINSPTYSGAPMERIGVNPNTCDIDWQGTDSIFDKWVIGSSARISLYFNDSAEVEELMSIGDREWKVNVYRSGVLFWSGYLISDGVSLPDSGVHYPITITATDGLEASDGIPFNRIIGDFTRVTTNSILGGSRCTINHVREFLMNELYLNLEMPIRWFCSQRNTSKSNEDFMSGNTVIFNYGDIFVAKKDLTVKWALDNLMSASRCRLMQFGGYWNIVNIDDLSRNAGILNGYSLSSRTANTSSAVSIDFNDILGLKINESTFTLVKKPVSDYVVTYDHTQNENIIPNGSFDSVSSSGLLYWRAIKGTPLVTYENEALNGREGRSMKIDNTAAFSGGVTANVSYTLDNINTMPFDSNVLFYNITWGFTFMPLTFPTTGGFIDWATNPLRVAITYTGYLNGIFRSFYLNEFGYWQGSSSSGSLNVIDKTGAGTFPVVTFEGNADVGQSFNISFWHSEVNEQYMGTVVFPSNMLLDDAMNYIVTQLPNSVKLSSNRIGINIVSTSEVAAYTTPAVSIDAEYISFKVESLKNDDIATVQFQSKGNQGRVLMPDCGVLDAFRPLEAGKLGVTFVVPNNVSLQLDDLYMNVENNNDVYAMSTGKNNAKEESSLGISSSFSGFMLSSYMDGFSTSDLSMVYANGSDVGRLTELYGKSALRMMSKPCRIVDTEVVGMKSILDLQAYDNKKYIVNKLTLNTEINSSKMTIFEVNYDDDLTITSKHYGNSNRG